MCSKPQNVSGSFVYDNSLREGEYTSVSNYHSYHESVAAGEKFEIQIRYHRKIDG